jgi:hypothetical protein
LKDEEPRIGSVGRFSENIVSMVVSLRATDVGRL